MEQCHGCQNWSVFDRHVNPLLSIFLTNLRSQGMEDQTLLRHLDNLFPPTMETFPMNYHQSSNDMDLGASFISFQAKDARVAAIPISHFSQTCYNAVTNQERPTKFPKPNSWTFSFGQPAQTENHHEECLLTEQQCQLQPYLTSHMGSLSGSLPKLKDEIHETIAPQTPKFKLETGVSQGSVGQECCITDLYSAVVSGSRDMPLSPSESIFGGNTSRLFSAQSVCGAPNCHPVPARASNNTQDHIMAERKRREKLSQRFIALSAIVPGLKKMDKASVLGDAIKYVKQLQERLKELEEQVPQKTSIAVSKANKSSLACNASQGVIDVIPAGGNREGSYEDLQPDIEVRMVSKNVLIRIHCEKRKGILVKILTELEKLQLSVINANVLSFSETAFDLTCTAQVEEGCEISAEDLVKALHNFLKKLK